VNNVPANNVHANNPIESNNVQINDVQPDDSNINRVLSYDVNNNAVVDNVHITDNVVNDVVDVENRKSREYGNNNVSGLNGNLLNTHPLKEQLLLGDNSEYKLEQVTNLHGDYSNNVNSYNKNNLITLNPYLSNGNNTIGNRINEGFEINQSNNNTIIEESANNIAPLLNDTQLPNTVPKNLLFTSLQQLNSAQNRSIQSPNKEPIRSSINMHSAQGYGSESGITGFNESGAPAINYLCVDN
jgi:hypothetical protein